MQFTDFERQSADHSRFMYDTIYFQSPDEMDEEEDDLEEDEGFEDENFQDKAEDMDDLHEIQVGDDLNEPNPDPDDDDHLPDDDLQ